MIKITGLVFCLCELLEATNCFSFLMTTPGIRGNQYAQPVLFGEGSAFPGRDLRDHSQKHSSGCVNLIV